MLISINFNFQAEFVSVHARTYSVSSYLSALFFEGEDGGGKSAMGLSNSKTPSTVPLS